MSAELRHSTFSVPRGSQKILTDRLSALLGKNRMPARGYRRGTGSSLSSSLSGLSARRGDFGKSVWKICRRRRRGRRTLTFSASISTASWQARSACISPPGNIRIFRRSRSFPMFCSLCSTPAESIIDSTRFVADEKLSRLHRGLPYATLRPCMLARRIFSAPTICSRRCGSSIRRFISGPSIIRCYAKRGPTRNWPSRSA